MTSPTFGRKEAREHVAARRRRRDAINQAMIAASTGLALLIASVGCYVVGSTGLSIWLAVCAIGSFVMVSAVLGDA